MPDAEEILNVHVVVSEASHDFFEYQLGNYVETAARPGRLFFYCYALDEPTCDRYRSDRRLSLCAPVYANPRAYRRKSWNDWKVFLRAMLMRRPALGGSNGHAAGLNHAGGVFARIAGHNIIADVDTVMLERGWDEHTVALLAEYDLFGAPYEDIAGFSSGDSKVQTYKAFACAVWVALAARVDFGAVDWMPAKERNVAIDSEELSRIYGLPVGYELVRDVGWELPGFVHARGLRHLALKHVKPSSPDCLVIRTGFDYNEEYQLEGAAMLAHHRGGSRIALRGNEMSNAFFDRVEEHLGRRPGTGGAGPQR